jgi:hypothetical protein
MLMMQAGVAGQVCSSEQVARLQVHVVDFLM